MVFFQMKYRKFELKGACPIQSFNMKYVHTNVAGIGESASAY